MPILQNRDGSALAAWKVLDKAPASVSATEVETAHGENKKLLGVKADIKVSKDTGRVRRASKGNEEATKKRTIVVSFAVPNVDQNSKNAVMVLAQNAYRASFKSSTGTHAVQNLDS